MARKRKAENLTSEQVQRKAESAKDGKRLSVAYCKKFLNDLGRDFTDEQIVQIRETLYLLAEVDYLISTKNRIGLPDEKEDPP